MRKKILSLLSLSLVMTLMLSACSSGNNANNTANNTGKATNEGSGNTAPAKATKVEFWTFQQLHAEFYTEMVKRWNAANPDKTIELVANVSPYDDVHNKLLVALQSGSGAPDFADIEISKFPNYIKGEPQLVPLNDIIEPELNNLV